MIACPVCKASEWEKRGTRRTYHPLTDDLKDDSWNEGDIDMDRDDEGKEVIYCCNCESSFTEEELRATSKV